MLSAQNTNGVAVRHFQCPGFQPDGLTSWSPLMATLPSGQPPIRKTAETQRGGRNQCARGIALINVK